MGEKSLYSKEGFLVARHRTRVGARNSPLPLLRHSCANFAVLQNKKEVKKI